MPRWGEVESFVMLGARWRRILARPIQCRLAGLMFGLDRAVHRGKELHEAALVESVARR